MIRNPEEIPLLFPDPVIEVYLKDVDRTLLRAMLQKTVDQRLQALEAMETFAAEGRRLREEARREALAAHDH